MKKLLASLGLACVLWGASLAPLLAQQSVVDGFRLPNGGYQFVTPTVGLPVNVIAGSGSGCAGTTGTPCFVNVQNWGAGGTALGAMANYGTSPGAVKVPGVNAYVTAGAITETNSAAILSAVQGSIPAGSALIGYTSNDPCSQAAKTNLAVDSNTTSLTQLIAASGSTKVYICSMSLIAAAATTVTFNTGTGTNCGTGTAGLIGGTTVANSMSLAANGGLTYGNGGGTVAVTGAGGEVCMALGTSVYVAGNISYVQQ